MDRWLYQDLAEPPPAATLAGEEVTLDKWYIALAEPVRRKQSLRPARRRRDPADGAAGLAGDRRRRPGRRRPDQARIAGDQAPGGRRHAAGRRDPPGRRPQWAGDRPAPELQRRDQAGLAGAGGGHVRRGGGLRIRRPLPPLKT